MQRHGMKIFRALMLREADAKQTRTTLGLRVRSFNRRKSASCGHYSFQLISPPMKFPPQAVIGGSSQTCAKGLRPLDSILRKLLD